MNMNNCSECGKQFEEDALINFGDSEVCAGCKPFFVQKLREGVNVAGEMVYAGFWIRVAAKFIDAIVSGVVSYVIGFAVSFVVVAGFIGTIQAHLISNILAWGFAVTYVTYFLGKYGATPGKMACGLKVLRPDGEGLSYGRAFGRFFAEILSAMILCIGYVMTAFDKEKRSLHDRICDTRVVKA
jgi:uncharacterized RDD family membrane protein YckC